MMIRSLSLQRQSLSKKELVWYIFIFLNLLALFQFGLLQIRTAFPDYYSGNIGTSFIRLMTSYNAWALCALIFIGFKPARLQWYHHLGFFLVLICLYSLTSSAIYNSDSYRIWRGFVMNITGLINLNLLFYLALIVACRYFLLPVQEESTKSTHLLVLKDGRSIRQFQKSEIVFIKSDQNYAVIKLKDESPLLIRKTLKEIEAALKSDAGFMRIQRSYIVNLDFISHAYISDNGIDMICETSTGDQIPVSRNKKSWLKPFKN